MKTYWLPSVTVLPQLAESDVILTDQITHVLTQWQCEAIIWAVDFLFGRPEISQ